MSRCQIQVNVRRLSRLADLYKCFSDATRLLLLTQLYEQGRMTVSALAESLGLSESAVSHQLRLLRQHRLVAVEREGRYGWYRLDDEHVEQLIRQGLEHIDERD